MDKKHFLALYLSFILATIVGTVSHELGHYCTARYFGYKARLHYASAGYTLSDTDFQTAQKRAIAISVGGPAQTMITGTVGVFLLLFFRKKYDLSTRLSPGLWCIIFLALFWLRQTANFSTWIIGYFLNGHFSHRGDEIKIASYYHIPSWSIIAPTACIGAFILGLVIFRFIPKKQRLTFSTAGLLGGISGYYLWLFAIGKYIIP